jgi:hypothetical protein
MAHVILGGLFTSTLLNMLVVPTFFARWGWESEEVFARQVGLAETEPVTPGPAGRLGGTTPIGHDTG